MKHDDGLDAWLTAMRYEMARACELPRWVVFGDGLPQDCNAPMPWRWMELGTVRIKNTEVQLLGKGDGNMLNVKGIDEKKLLAALHNAARKDTEESVGAVYDMDVSPERAGVILYGLNGGQPEKKVYIKKMHGRYIYMEFWRGMTQIDCTRYDAHNGQGKAAEVVAALRKEIADKKNAERKAERAKRHRVAVYWQDDNDKICHIATGKTEHQNIMAAAYLLGRVLADAQEEWRATEYDNAVRRVQETVRENAGKVESDA